MDRIDTNILVLVTSNPGEKPGRRKDKGSLATFISQGLGDPKLDGNPVVAKGKQVNIPALFW